MVCSIYDCKINAVVKEVINTMMSRPKFKFLRFLNEFDGTGSGSAYSANGLSKTQMTQDPMKDEDEKSDDKEDALEKEINDALSDHSSGNLKDFEREDDKDDSQERVLSMLKNLLFKEPGYEHDFDKHEDETNAKEDDHTVDHEQFTNGEEIDGVDPTNPRKSPDYTMTQQGPDAEDDKHEQLIGAIRELKKELSRHRGEDDAHIEQEEDIDSEDEADDTTQYANAQKMFAGLVNQKMSRAKIIASFEKNLGVTNSTAVSYYQRLAKDAGLTNSGDRTLNNNPTGLGTAQTPDATTMPQNGQQGLNTPQQETNVDGTEVPNDPNKQGLIRTVKGAHLVYKRKNEEGTFDELWLFGTGDEMENSLEVRRNILAGTDIPPRSTKSQNGAQSYTLKTFGNGQLLCIKGLPN